jgi:hypothetical protein
VLEGDEVDNALLVVLVAVAEDVGDMIDCCRSGIIGVKGLEVIEKADLKNFEGNTLGYIVVDSLGLSDCTAADASLTDSVTSVEGGLSA